MFNTFYKYCYSLLYLWI